MRIVGRLPAGLPGGRQAVRAVFDRVFGPPPVSARSAPGDPGLFGPGSASWRVLAEPAGIVGGVRALTIQLLHPGAMAGVADHSRFDTDPLGRLQRTAAYVATVAFGSLPEVVAASKAVRKAHTFVRGTTPTGHPYAADDPHLLAWVQIALTSSFLATDRAYAPDPVLGSDADAFVAEQSRAAALLDPRVDLDALDAQDLRTGPLPMLSEGLLPNSVPELEAALERYGLELELNEQSRRTLRFLRWPSIPLAVRAGYLPLFAGAVATIPAGHRRLLGLPSNTAADAAVRAQARTLLAGLRVVAGTSQALAIAERRAYASGRQTNPGPPANMPPSTFTQRPSA